MSANTSSEFHLNNRTYGCSNEPSHVSSKMKPGTFQHVLRSTAGISKRSLNDSKNAAVGICHDPMNTSKFYPVRENVKDEVAAEHRVEDLWLGNYNYTENLNGGSNLFISWCGTASELLVKLLNLNFQIKTVSRTRDERIFDVIFHNHINARKAFLRQREIQLRMVPPKNSHRNWMKNPSPKFLVKFETKFRLIVKKGKAECHDIVGELLMSNYKKQRGCIIWADQLKGHRIRVVTCEGNFMFPDGRIVKMRGVNSETKIPLGWISYRSKRTREWFITRLSGNELEDYIYRD